MRCSLGRHVFNSKRVMLWIFNLLAGGLKQLYALMTYQMHTPDPDPLVRGMDPDPDPSIIKQK